MNPTPPATHEAWLLTRVTVELRNIRIILVAMFVITMVGLSVWLALWLIGRSTVG